MRVVVESRGRRGRSGAPGKENSYVGLGCPGEHQGAENSYGVRGQHRGSCVWSLHYLL